LHSPEAVYDLNIQFLKIRQLYFYVNSKIGKEKIDFMKDPLELKPKIVAGNIRKIREYRNYTQDYLAAKLAISQNAYSKIELGYSKLTLDRLFQIAIILDIKVMDLINIDHRSVIKLELPPAASEISTN